MTDEIATRLARLEAEEQLWREHHAPSVAGSLRSAWSGVAFFEGGRDELIIRDYLSALDAADAGKLTPHHVATVARWAKSYPRARIWSATLRCLLERQSPKRAEAGRATVRYEAQPWAGGYAGDARKKGETDESLIRRTKHFFEVDSDELTAGYLGVPVDVVRRVRAERKP